MLKAIFRLMGFSQASTESGGSKSKERSDMEHGMDMSLLAIGTQQQRRNKPLKCTKCSKPVSGMNEHGYPIVICGATMALANPDDCSEFEAGCAE